MKKTLKIKQALAQSNEELLRLNNKLNSMNSQLNDTNNQLCEINSIKEYYIAESLMYALAISIKWRNIRICCIK